MLKGVMETQCSTRPKMLEPPLLLRRPLPPKFLPALQLSSPKKSTHAELISRGNKHLKEPCFPEKSYEPEVLVNIENRSKAASPSENRTIEHEGWLLEQRAPTPATSRVTSIDRNQFYYDSKGQQHGQQNDAKLLLDQIQTGNTISPSRHSGPEAFPIHRHHIRPSVQLQHLLEYEPYYESAPKFTLQDMMSQKTSCLLTKEKLRTPVCSPYHYNMLMDLLTVRLQQRKQTKVNVLLLSSSGIPEKTSRVTQRQLLLEQKLKDALPPEEGGADVCGSSKVAREFQHAGSNHLQNLRTTYSGGETITPCELAVLDCLAHGGISLYLKAYFINSLPDLTLIAQTLVYVNLSFNDLQHFPTEVYDIENLEVLKLRNNPIKEIPSDIHKLRKLKYFVMSFCLLSALPPGLFLLTYLEVLDVSYNDISSVPNDICNLSLLEFLNVEGNQLPALPCGSLKLRLKQLRVSNNMMHPLFWNENTWLKPQRLTDLAALSFSRNSLWQCYSPIPKDAEHILSKFTICDCCKKPMYGLGFRLIRPCKKIFGVRKLPFIFSACSPSCYNSFMSQKDTLADSLYGNLSETENQTAR